MPRHLRVCASVLGVLALASSSAPPQQRDTTVQTPVNGTDTMTVVVGYVVDGSGEPVDGAEVSVVGRAPGARTDSSGAFLLGGVPARPQELRVRRVGFHAVTLSVAIPAGGATEYVITLERMAQALPEVVVEETAAATMGKLSPFYRRQQFGQGTFFTREQIEQRRSVRLSDVLRHARGLKVVPLGANRYAVGPATTPQEFGGTGAVCGVVAVWLRDGSG